MIRNCISPDQKDWVARLPAIEFAINSARSESTGYAPFFLNTGRVPRSMIWNSPSDSEFPGVREFAETIKTALMAAHDCILVARVKQTRDANRHRRSSPLAKGDLVYLSTKNISLPKGLARKLAPKYIGPYLISRDFGNNSYEIELPEDLKRRGIHNVFHASLLRVHIPNDDRLFPGRLGSQIGLTEPLEKEWKVSNVLSHVGKGERAIFQVEWASGDRTWLPYTDAEGLAALQDYFDVLGITKISELKEGAGSSDDEPGFFLGAIDIECGPNVSERRKGRKKISSDIRVGEGPSGLKKDETSTSYFADHCISALPCPSPIHQNLDDIHFQLDSLRTSHLSPRRLTKAVDDLDSSLYTLHISIHNKLYASPASTDELHPLGPVFHRAEDQQEADRLPPRTSDPLHQACEWRHTFGLGRARRVQGLRSRMERGGGCTQRIPSTTRIHRRDDHGYSRDNRRDFSTLATQEEGRESREQRRHTTNTWRACPHSAGVRDRQSRRMGGGFSCSTSQGPRGSRQERATAEPRQTRRLGPQRELFPSRRETNFLPRSRGEFYQQRHPERRTTCQQRDGDRRTGYGRRRRLGLDEA